MNGEEWKVYIIETASGKLYTGITNNLERRFEAHKNSPKGARFFHFSRPSKIIFVETHPNRSEASKREYAIKKMTRKEKLQLISVDFSIFPAEG
jgi:putative endonuclease